MEEREKRKLSKRRYLTAFALTTLIFVFGILIGSGITKHRIEEIEKITKEMKTDLLDSEVQSFVIRGDICNISFDIMEEQLRDMASKISYMESQYGKEDERVVRLKKPYLLLCLKYFFLLEERREKCDENYTMIMFFYSNKPGKVEESEKQGYVLEYIRKKYGSERIKAIGLDIDLGLGSIEMLRRIYKIEEVPSLVINGKLYEGFQEVEKLIDILGLR